MSILKLAYIFMENEYKKNPTFSNYKILLDVAFALLHEEVAKS